MSTLHRVSMGSCRATRLAVVVAIVATIGCGRASNSTTVSGHVTYQQKPVTNGLINFVATGSRPVGGGINGDGTYSVELPAGEYQVRIDTPPEFPPGYKEGDAIPASAARQVPERFANFNSSGLTATVKAEGPQTIDFPLQ